MVLGKGKNESERQPKAIVVHAARAHLEVIPRLEVASVAPDERRGVHEAGVDGASEGPVGRARGLGVLVLLPHLGGAELGHEAGVLVRAVRLELLQRVPAEEEGRSIASQHVGACFGASTQNTDAHTCPITTTRTTTTTHSLRAS